MEHTLRCNSLKCRRELREKAVVTTCSHVFCLDCSNQSKLRQPDGGCPVCPACHVQLPQPDDAVLTDLNPPDDYKTSLLSGFSPNVIMECAGRALSFWAYQATQEIVYQEYLAKNLTNKYATLNTQLDKIIHDANAEISNLRNKMSNMQIERDNLQRRNEELANLARDKSKKLLHAQELYDKSKRRDHLERIQHGACDAVEDTIQTSTAAGRFVDRTGNGNQKMPLPPLFHQDKSNGMQIPGQYSNGMANSGVPNGRGLGDGIWSGLSSQGSQSVPPAPTPSTHRQRLVGGNAPTPRIGLAYAQSGFPGTPMQQQRTSPRQPLSNLNGNVGLSGFAGYGMSAGLKTSNPTGGGQNVMGHSRVPSRVAQRSISAGSSNPAFGGAAAQQNMFTNGGGYY